ncbi:MAG: hypothetical protein ACRDVM_00155 [Acidimicrobiia bacterium]
MRRAGFGRMARDQPSTILPMTPRVAWYLLLAAVLSAMLSRTAVAFAGLPAVVNFVHFPLVLAAYAVARRPVTSGWIRTAERLLVVSAILTATSWIGGSDSSLIRALLLWPVLMEPFIVMLTIWHLTASGMPAAWPRLLAVGIVLAEVPIALVQGALLGTGDAVRGTLIQQGAGHHVLGLMGLAVALWGLGSIVSGASRVRWLSGATVVGGFSLGILTDVKQGVAVFLVVAVFLGLGTLRGRFRSSRAVLALALVSLLVVLVSAFDTFAILSREPGRATSVVEAKTASLALSSGLMREAPVSFLVGLGPGTTFTRVAWLTSPLGEESFLQSFDLEPTPVVLSLSREWMTNPAWVASSASSPFSTWTGVFGDLGILGLTAYAALWWLPWRMAGGGDRGNRARSVILFSVMLGLLFNWLEEPQFVIVAGLLIGAESAPKPGGADELSPAVLAEPRWSSRVPLRPEGPIRAGRQPSPSGRQ